MKITKEYLRKVIKEAISEDYDTAVQSGALADAKQGEFIIIGDDGMDLNFVGKYANEEKFKKEFESLKGDGDVSHYGLQVIEVDLAGYEDPDEDY